LTTLQAHLLALATPIFAAISQILMKWQTSLTAHQLQELDSKFLYLAHFLLRPWVIAAFFFTFLGGITWILAISKLELSQAYPYVAITYVVVSAAGVFLFGETLSAQKVIGTAVVTSGIGLVMLDS
jgi:drug/metabolite transporter (DMT)-like permease